MTSHQEQFDNLRKTFGTRNPYLSPRFTHPDFLACSNIQDVTRLYTEVMNEHFELFSKRFVPNPDNNPLDLMKDFYKQYGNTIKNTLKYLGHK